MSRVCGLFLFAFGMGLFIALIFPKTLFMVVVAALCLLIGYISGVFRAAEGNEADFGGGAGHAG